MEVLSVGERLMDLTVLKLKTLPYQKILLRH